MTAFILDDQLAPDQVEIPLRRWLKVAYLRDARPNEVIKDDRVETILHALRQPTFITIDRDFWSTDLRHPRYCVLYFALREDEQRALPELLRRLLRLPEFRTCAARMGKVARVSRERVQYWQQWAVRISVR